jgi:hypothetical protein
MLMTLLRRIMSVRQAPAPIPGFELVRGGGCVSLLVPSPWTMMNAGCRDGKGYGTGYFLDSKVAVSPDGKKE